MCVSHLSYGNVEYDNLKLEFFLKKVSLSQYIMECISNTTTLKKN